MIKRGEFLASGAGAVMTITLPDRTNAPKAGTRVLRIRRLHWAGISLAADDTQLFIDPVTENPGDPVPIPSYKNSFAIVSHHHSDHFDPKNLAIALGDNGFLAIEERVARWADTRTLQTQIVSMYQPVMMPRASATFCVIPVPAADGLGAPQTSWVIEANGIKVLHLGDTQWHGGFWDIARAYGPFDVVFVPINGFQFVVGRYLKVEQPMSLTPEQAASALQILKPAFAVPIHYGEPSPPTYFEYESALEAFLGRMKGKATQVVPLNQGEELAISS